jgi:CheY-like chemotaxis protein
MMEWSYRDADSTGTGRAAQAFVVMAETNSLPEPLILVVEDEELLRLHAADLLEQHGFRVVDARNAAAALKVLEARGDVRLLCRALQGLAHGTFITEEICWTERLRRRGIARHTASDLS